MREVKGVGGTRGCVTKGQRGKMSGMRVWGDESLER